MTAALPRFRVLAAHVRGLDDDALNDLLVELPRERFAALVEVTLRRPSRPAGLVLRFRHVTRHPGEVSRWRVLAHAGNGRQVVLGEVAQERTPTLGGGDIATWRAYTRAGQPVGLAHRLDGIRRGGWDRRSDAAAALAWASPASGARCMVLAAHVRGLDDDALNDLLVELPCERFDRLCNAAFVELRGVA